MASSSSSSTTRFCDRMERIPQPLLPQHGGPAASTSNSFTTLLPAHPFLFRVYTPHSRQNLRSPSPAHSRYGSRASSRTRTSSRAASPPPSRSMSMQHHPHSTPSRPLSRHSSYFSSSHSAAADESTDVDEPFFLSPRSKELRDAASDVVSHPEWRPRQRTVSTLSRFSGMSGMSGFSDVSTTQGALSDSWTSVGGETAVDEDMMIDVDNEEKEAENTVSELGLTRSLSSALIVPHSPTKMHRRAASFESRNQLGSMSSSMSASGRFEDSQILDEKPSLSALLSHLDPGTRHSSSYVSASMSFFYALWEAVRRYRINVKHDVEIAIIDGKDFIEDDGEEGTVQRVYTVDEMMHMKESDSTVKLDDPSIAKPLAHLVASQTTLIQGTIASSAVYSSLQLRDVIPALPGYFFKHEDGRQTFDSKTFESLIWDAFASSSSPEKKRRSQTSFRQFCATATRAFLSDERSHGDRIRDSTTGAVNLAGTLVGRWAKARIKEVLNQERVFGGEDEDPFADPPNPEELRQKQLDDARDEITLVITHLTMLIAAWPSRSWFDTHLAEINGIIDDVVEIYVRGLIEASQMEQSSGGDERRGREEMRDGHRVHSPIPTRRAFSITRGLQSGPDAPVTPPRTPPRTQTPPSSISRAGSERARMRSPLAFGERDSPSSVGKGIGRSLSFGGVLDSGGDNVSGSASAAGGLLPSAEIVAPRPHPPSRPLTPAHSSLHSRPSTPPTGSSVHFATPSPAPSPARHHSEIKRPKSPIPPVPPRRSTMRSNSAHSTPPSSSAGHTQNLEPAPFPTSATNSPQPERSSSVASRASLPHSKSQPDGILRKSAKEGSDDGSTKEKNSRLTWPRTLKRVGSVPGNWPKDENGSVDSVVASSEKGGSSVKNGEGSLSKRNSLFGKPRQRTVTLTRATTGPKKDREISKEMEAEHKDERGDAAEKRKRKLSLGHLDLHIGDFFRRGTKKGKEKQKSGSVIAAAISAGALATQASGMISKSSSKATSSDVLTGASSTAVREVSTVSETKADNASSTSLSKSKEVHDGEATELSTSSPSPEVPVVALLPEKLSTAKPEEAGDEVRPAADAPLDSTDANGLEVENDRRAVLSPVHESEKEAEGEATSPLVPLPSDNVAEVAEHNEHAVVEAPEQPVTAQEVAAENVDGEAINSSSSVVDEMMESRDVLEDTHTSEDASAEPSAIADEVKVLDEAPAATEGEGHLESVNAVEDSRPGITDVDEFESREEGNDLTSASDQQVETTVEEVAQTPQLLPVHDSEPIPEESLDDLETSIIDPDIEWTDHEYGKSLESIDESIEEIAREDVEEVSPVMALADPDNTFGVAEEEVGETQIASVDDERDILQGLRDSLLSEESLELPGAFVMDEEVLPSEAPLQPVEPDSLLSTTESQPTDGVDQPRELETLANELHKDLSDAPVDAPGFFSFEKPLVEHIVPSEDDVDAPEDGPSFISLENPLELPVGSSERIVESLPDSQKHAAAYKSKEITDAPEIELVKLISSSPQFKEAQANAISTERSVDGGASDDFDGMSETAFSAANSGRHSDDEDLSLSWNWKISPRNQPIAGESSELRTRRRAQSLSSAERERVPTFVNPSNEATSSGRKEEISLVRSSSWAVSCFVCGVLVTLFVMSTQRRDLLTGHRLT
ncbi:hypothetical protein SCHPADRAFT_998330 [Schizopora paradoxa]|uniref:DUF7587 domain-containing protein n=1 Tax=Schizopora paradoxa TaxID=27342 RepID=A0A0H2RRS0_9AGAM|nr:hypothetical protein SCHPADRAFT_998330 [Schizopora paradoxa]